MKGSGTCVSRMAVESFSEEITIDQAPVIFDESLIKQPYYKGISIKNSDELALSIRNMPGSIDWMTGDGKVIFSRFMAFSKEWAVYSHEADSQKVLNKYGLLKTPFPSLDVAHNLVIDAFKAEGIFIPTSRKQYLKDLLVKEIPLKIMEDTYYMISILDNYKMYKVVVKDALRSLKINCEYVEYIYTLKNGQTVVERVPDFSEELQENIEAHIQMTLESIDLDTYHYKSRKDVLIYLQKKYLDTISEAREIILDHS